MAKTVLNLFKSSVFPAMSRSEVYKNAMVQTHFQKCRGTV